MKALKKISIITVSVLFLVVLSGLVLVNLYEDEIKTYALNEISSQLKSDIKVSSVDLTLWAQFPSASLKFHDVYIEETFEEKDTLIFAESVFLNFSLSDFISGNYNVKAVAIENSTINLKRRASGEDNYHFWQESEGKSAQFSIDLEEIDLQNSAINYSDGQSKTNLSLLAKSNSISGNISSETLELTGDIDTQVYFLEVDEESYITDKSLSGKTHLSVNLKEEVYSFSETQLAVNELPISISGSIDLNETGTDLNLNAQTEKADLKGVIQNLPHFVQEKLSEFSSSGLFESSISITGEVSKGKLPNISSKFSLEKANIKNSSSGMSLENVSAEGSYTAKTGKEDLLEFSAFSCELGTGKFNGKGKASRLKNPFINAEMSGNIELEAFNNFFNFEEIDHLEGSSNVSLNYRGNLGEGWIPSSSSLKKADVSGRFNIQDGELKLARNPHKIENISGEFLMTNGDAAVNNLMAEIGKSDFKFDGFFRNLVPYLLVETEVLKLESTLTSNHVDFNTLLSSSSSSEEDYKVNLPDRIDFNLSTDIAALEFREFTASDISAKVKLSSSRLDIKPIGMNTSGGRFTADISALQQKNGNFKINSKGNLNRVDISSLFSSFEDFQQSFITHNHLKGVATSDFSFTAYMNNALGLLSETVDVTANIKIENGELIGHQSLIEMGQYLSDKKLLSAVVNMNKFSDKLNHVRFSELNNRIIIKDSKVSIPKMEIMSDALNIIAEGSHSFSNDINYSVGFDVADLAARKEYSEDEKGLSKMIFVSMDGTTSSPSFGYDRLAVKEERKENRQEEAQKIKSLLKDEFSRKDSSVKTDAAEKDKKDRIKVVWSDTPEEEPKKDPEPEKEKPKKPTIILDNSSEDEEDDDF